MHIPAESVALDRLSAKELRILIYFVGCISLLEEKRETNSHWGEF